MVTKDTITDFLRENGYADSVICLHSSFKSLGPVESKIDAGSPDAGGPDTVIDGFLAAGVTLLVPAFYYLSVTAPPKRNYFRNGIDYPNRTFDAVSFTGLPDQIEPSMGVIPRRILARPEALRSKHPCNGFAAIGPRAQALMEGEGNLNVYSAYKRIFESGDKAWIFMLGTQLTSCTPIHFAEERAGRELFRRWAVANGQTVEVQTGSCSDGFANFEPELIGMDERYSLGESVLRVFAFRAFIEAVTEIILTNPRITACENPRCLRCPDMIAGGPILK